MSDDNPFDGLENPQVGFIGIVQSAKKQLRTDLENAQDVPQARDAKHEYLIQVMAAARVCGIAPVTSLMMPNPGQSTFDFEYSRINLAVTECIFALQKGEAEWDRQFSVELSAPAKHAIHDLIGKIRQVIEGGSLDRDKKNALLARLNALAAEVDRNRTRFDIAMANILAFSSTTGGALEAALPAPIRKFVAQILGILSDETEHGVPKLAPPPKASRLPAPKSAAKPPAKKSKG